MKVTNLEYGTLVDFSNGGMSIGDALAFSNEVMKNEAEEYTKHFSSFVNQYNDYIYNYDLKNINDTTEDFICTYNMFKNIAKDVFRSVLDNKELSMKYHELIKSVMENKYNISKDQFLESDVIKEIMKMLLDEVEKEIGFFYYEFIQVSFEIVLTMVVENYKNIPESAPFFDSILMDRLYKYIDVPSVFQAVADFAFRMVAYENLSFYSAIEERWCNSK